MVTVSPRRAVIAELSRCFMRSWDIVCTMGNKKVTVYRTVAKTNT